MRTPLSAVALACAAGVLGFVVPASAAPRPAVLVRGTVDKVPSYQKSFAVSACKAVSAKGVTLSADDGDEFSLVIRAAALPGKLLISGGDGEDAFYITGKVTAVTVTGPKAKQKVLVKGAFAADSKVRGVFTVTGDCP